MLHYVLPAVFAIFLWWFSTGLILYLDGLAYKTYRWTFAGATILLMAAIYGLHAGSTDTTTYGAYLSFTCGLVIWGWHEVSFLTGYVTGPRKTGYEEGTTGWRRFCDASNTIIYHEIAIALTGVGICFLLWDAPNQVGMWTYLILWGMRLSTKFNIFLGVPNITVEFLPSHLDHLKSYFAKRSMNLLFPVSITAATIVTVMLVMNGHTDGTTDFQSLSSTLLATIAALGLLEHWFLVLPIPVARAWEWGMASHQHEGEDPSTSPPLIESEPSDTTPLAHSDDRSSGAKLPHALVHPFAPGCAEAPAVGHAPRGPAQILSFMHWRRP